VGGSVAGAGGQQQQQQPYRAFSPLAAQGDQVQRKPVQGSFREI
jgi:hypothetical protein